MSLKHGQGTVKKLKKEDPRYWFEMKYRGIRIRRCTGETVSREAVAWAKKHLEGIKEEIDKQQNREKCLLSDLVALYKKALVTYMPYRNLHVTATETRPISDKYYAANIVYLERYVNFMKKRGGVYTYDISEEDVEEYNRFLREKFGLGASYNCVLASLRHIHKVLGKRIIPNYWRDIERVSQRLVKAKQAKKQPFALDELQLMFDESDKLLGTELAWIWFAVRAGFYTGLRCADVITLKWSELDEEGFISHKDLKTGKENLLYCPDLVPIVALWRQNSGALGEYILQYQAETYLGARSAAAKNAKGKKPAKIKANRAQASKQFMRWIRSLKVNVEENGVLIKKSAINTRNANGKTVKGFHSLRVSHATYHAAQGGTLEEIQARLKHSSAATTEGYIQLDLEQKKALLRTNHRKMVI